MLHIILHQLCILTPPPPTHNHSVRDVGSVPNGVDATEHVGGLDSGFADGTSRQRQDTAGNNYSCRRAPRKQIAALSW